MFLESGVGLLFITSGKKINNTVFDATAYLCRRSCPSVSPSELFFNNENKMFECGTSLITMKGNDTVSDDEVVTSYVPPVRYSVERKNS